jgi:hypothetical protein
MSKKFRALSLARSQPELLNTFADHASKLVNQGVRAVQLRNVVAAAYALPVHEYVRDGFSAGHHGQLGLQTSPERVFVEFYHGRGRDDRVSVEEDSLSAAGVRTICFGEYDNCIYDHVRTHSSVALEREQEG